MNELGRQLIHLLFGLVLIIACSLLGQQNSIFLLLLLLFGGLLLLQLKLRKFSLPVIDGILENFDRNEKIPARGALAYVAGLLFVFSFSSFNFALGITAILAFGDGFATLVGISGRTRLFYNKSKTLEGLVAFVVAGTASSMLFLGVWPAVAYSIVLALIESIDFKVDDNISIPVVSTLLKTFLGW